MPVVVIAHADDACRTVVQHVLECAGFWCMPAPAERSVRPLLLPDLLLVDGWGDPARALGELLRLRTLPGGEDARALVCLDPRAVSPAVLQQARALEAAILWKPAFADDMVALLRALVAAPALAIETRLHAAWHTLPPWPGG